MLLQAFTGCEAHIFLRQGMEHNKFNYTSDIIEPLNYFLKINKIGTKEDVRLYDQKRIDRLRKRGYIDWRAITAFKEKDKNTLNRYYNNVFAKFKAQTP